MPRLKLPFPFLLSIGLVLILIVIVSVFLVLPDQSADPGFDARVDHPAYTDRRPKVLFDEAHYNVDKSGGRYKPFADLIRNDGYEVTPNTQPFTIDSLKGYDVLVIANPLGLRGAAQQLANLFRLEGKLHIATSAFTPDECVAVRDWIQDGGSLLLIADHAPAGEAAGALSSLLGVEMTNWYVEDKDHEDPETRNPSFLVFSRKNGLLKDHAITRGLQSVITFTGQALRPPPGAVSFLSLAPGAVEYPRRKAMTTEGRSAANLAQGVALEFGKGRVVVLGEAAMMTSQVARANGSVLRFGLSHPNHQNRQLAINIMHWLSRLIEN